MIEDTYLNVCKRCAKLGSVLEEPVQIPQKKNLDTYITNIQEINPDFKGIIKSARDAKKMTRKELAQAIGQKESVIARIEKGIRPTQQVVKKLEKVLDINLTYEEQEHKILVQKTEEITLGDVLEIRVRKKA